MRVLITGAAGFIGAHIVEAILRTTDWGIVTLDRLDTSGTLHRLTDLGCWEKEHSRVKFVWHDLKAPLNDFLALRIGAVDAVLHLAASSHVDRSITDPMSFVMDNVVGMCNLLDWARRDSGPHLYYFSTDEVYGPAPGIIAYSEGDRHNPGNPYAATKAAAEDMCHAYANTYRMPITITNTMNVFGERQHCEKYCPLVIRKVLDGDEVIIHADKTLSKAGSRFYIHARNLAAGLLFLIQQGCETLSADDPAEGQYNIVGEKELDNLQFAQFIADTLERPLKYRMVDFHSSRPGHDMRYALDGSKMAKLGWTPPVGFEESLRRTILWYQDHQRWLGRE